MSVGILLFVTAILVVLVTSILKTVDMSTKVKEVVATVVSVAGGAVATVVDNGGFDHFSATGLMGSVLLVYGAATLIHKFVLPKSADDFLEQSVGNK